LYLNIKVNINNPLVLIKRVLERLHLSNQPQSIAILYFLAIQRPKSLETRIIVPTTQTSDCGMNGVAYKEQMYTSIAVKTTLGQCNVMIQKGQQYDDML
jgi:hypothetical protein